MENSHTKAEVQIKERGSPWNTHLKIRCLYQFPHLRTQGTPWKKSFKECKIQSARRTPGEQSRWMKLTRLIWAHKGCSSKKRTYMGLPQVLCLHIIAFNLSFSWDFWICELVGLWLLCPLLGFFHLLSCLLWLQCDTFYFIFYIL